MSDRRILSGALAVAIAVLFALLQGCGSKFELPTEHREGRTIPVANTYQVIDTWHAETTSPKTFNGVNDILLTQGNGSQLFVLFNYGGVGTAPRGEVREYYLTRPSDTGRRFLGGMFNPVTLAVGGNGFGGTADRIFVLDQGDTCLAKFNPDSGTCTPLVVRNLNYWWRVREYGLLGGDTISTFTDTLKFSAVHGIAADAAGNVFVSGVLDSTFSDAFDGRVHYRESFFRIYKYSRGPRYPGVVPFDKNMPGARWHRDTTFIVSEGSGIGYVNDARGMAWNNTGFPGLYVADFGNNSGQKLDDRVPNSGFYRLSADDQGSSLTGPVDIAVDLAGFAYVSDTGNHRVLRYDAAGSFVQRVDIQPDDLGRSLVEPVGVAANDSIVYVADRTLQEIVRYQKR